VSFLESNDEHGAPTSDALATQARILKAYAGTPEAFWAGTKDHDVRQNYAALLDSMKGPGPFTILDLGCGPGRDLRYFASLGHRAVGVEGSAPFVAMAREYSGCEVLEQGFLSLDLEPEAFDGVFANASLFHVPSAALRGVLVTLRRALKPCGVLFASNPHGADTEGWNGDRYGAYYRPETWLERLKAAGFDEVLHYYRPPGLPRSEQRWFATVHRKPSQSPLQPDL
jgi:SAM-dependent methyltransferase